MDVDNRLIVSFEASMTKLSSQLDGVRRAVYGAASDIEKTVAKTDAKFNSLFSSAQPAKAIQLAFQQVSLTTVNNTIGRLGTMGQALRALGPAGIAAGVGILATGAAIAKAISVADWAKDLTRAAGALGLTTDQLQKFDFIATATGIPVDKMREGLSGLNKTIGLVESGLARPLTARAITGLGISADDLRSWGSLDAILPHILDALAKLNAPERAAFASRMRIDPETLNSLVEARGKLGDLADQAQKYGIVIDASVIAKSAAAADEMHVAKEVIDAELRKAFVDLLPAIVPAVDGLVKIAEKLAAFVQDCKDALTPIGNLIAAIDNIPHDIAIALHLDTSGLSDQLADFKAEWGAGVWQGLFPVLSDFQAAAAQSRHDQLTAPSRGPASDLFLKPGHQVQGELAGAGVGKDPNQAELELLKAELGLATDLKLRAQLQKQITAVEKKIAAESGAVPTTPKAGRGARAAREPKAPEDLTSSADKEASDALDRAMKDLAEAYKALTGDAQKRAEFEIQANNAEAAAEQEKLKAQRDQLDKDVKAKKLSPPAAQADEAKLDQAAADIEAARVAKNKLAQQQADYKIEDQEIEVHKKKFDAEIAELQAQADITTNAKTRRDIEATILQLRQQEARDLEGTARSRAVGEGTMTPGQAASEAASQGESQAAESADAAHKAYLDANPLAAYADQQEKQYGDIGKDSQTLAVQGIEAINNGLVQAVMNFKNLGEVARSVLRQILADMLQMALHKFEAGILGKIFGLAGGGPVASAGGGGGGGGGSGAGAIVFGGLADGGPVPGFPTGGRVSGPGTSRSDSILARLSHGEFVINAEATRRNLPVLDAINRGLPTFGEGGLVGSVLRMPSIGPAITRGPSNEIHFHLDHPVVTQDLLDQMNEIGNASMNKAVLTSARLASRSFLATQTRTNLLQG